MDKASNWRDNFSAHAIEDPWVRMMKQLKSWSKQLNFGPQAPIVWGPLQPFPANLGTLVKSYTDSGSLTIHEGCEIAHSTKPRNVCTAVVCPKVDTFIVPFVARKFLYRTNMWIANEEWSSSPFYKNYSRNTAYARGNRSRSLNA